MVNGAGDIFKTLKKLSEGNKSKTMGIKGFNHVNLNEKNLNKLIKTIIFYC